MVMECGGGDALYLGSLVRARERASTFEDGPMDISQIETQKEKRTKNSRTFKSEKSIKMDHTYIHNWNTGRGMGGETENYDHLLGITIFMVSQLLSDVQFSAKCQR